MELDIVLRALVLATALDSAVALKETLSGITGCN